MDCVDVEYAMYGHLCIICIAAADGLATHFSAIHLELVNPWYTFNDFISL